MQRLRAWIAAQPLDSAYVWYTAVGKALFYYYPIPRDRPSRAFWLKYLNKTFDRKFGQVAFQSGPDHSRSVSRLHWVKVFDGRTGTPVPPVVWHQCIPGCAARCGRDKCAFESRDDKTLGGKEHVMLSLIHI